MHDKHDHTPPPSGSVDLARVQTVALVIIAFAVVLFLLVQARFMLVSLATAIVLFSLTSAVIDFIARQRLGPFRVPDFVASIAALVMIAAALMAASGFMLTQINNVLITTLSFAEQAPSAVASLFGFMGESTEASILSALQSINVGSYARTAATRASDVTQAAVLVILFVGFLFAERIWFDIKLVNLIGDQKRAERISKIVSSIIWKVNYYLWVKTVVSALTGLMTYALAVSFDIELAVAIGLITFILNFIPNVGSIIATGMVALIAHIQLHDPALTVVIVSIAGGIQFINGNIIDPMMMGRALRLSSFGIIISLAFWGAVWGIPGMFLSVPIMVMLLVVCSHVPALRPLAILLSREGLPEDETALYQTPDRPQRTQPPINRAAR
ncbi:putative PurR-regulated permease PerM [Loktanella ponticola]|uniref:Putative PurR-regulated permease PerM n=1 Tax=Yoonia ponticola TaxID=1524255 RepID=A0A7W9EZ47_9RHOB|nr:AI-2E family transporter [Yoonia ponticola]MBB5721571.1 putative PurR-regulated permease PerM [Yoonia ponticola]